MSVHDYWWTALGLGLVVIVAAAVLLQMLLDPLHRVEDASGRVLQVAEKVAGNTISAAKLETTSKGLDLLAEETIPHEHFLREVTSTKAGS